MPIFGKPLDDDIVQTAGRLAGEVRDDLDEEGATIEAIWVFEMPMSLPIDARLPEPQVRRAQEALRRAKAVGEEYEGVHVQTAMVRARRAGEAIVREAKRRGVEAIVLAAEEPSRVRGGALFGGNSGPLDNYVGEVTKHVLRKAACRVILTAPAAEPRPVAVPRETGTDGSGPRRRRGNLPGMFILVVGAGRVGSAVAKRALAAGHEVSVLDEDPLSHEQLDKDLSETWEDAGGRYTVGTALEVDALIEAGIEQADVFIASTNGDNTNLVIAQIAQRRFDVPRVVVRVLDPGRAAWYAEQGLHTICPTQHAIDLVERAASDPAA